MSEDEQSTGDSLEYSGEFQILGKVDDYDVVLTFPSDALLDPNKVSVHSKYEVGLLKYLVDLARGQGVVPRYQPKVGSPTSSASQDEWKCPEHGSSKVSKAPWGQYQCGAWVEANDDTPTAPSWAKPEPAETNGQYRWYCNHKGPKVEGGSFSKGGGSKPWIKK